VERRLARRFERSPERVGPFDPTKGNIMLALLASGIYIGGGLLLLIVIIVVIVLLLR